MMRRKRLAVVVGVLSVVCGIVTLLAIGAVGLYVGYELAKADFEIQATDVIFNCGKASEYTLFLAMGTIEAAIEESCNVEIVLTATAESQGYSTAD